MGSLERHCNSFMVFIPSSIIRCDGRDTRVEEDGGRQTGRGTWRKIGVELETSAMQTDTGCSIIKKCGLVIVNPARGELSLGKYAPNCLACFCERPSSIAPRWVKGGRQELECTQSGKENVQLPAVHHCCGANRGRIVSLQSRYSSPSINLSPFFLRNFGPERKHACSF